MAKKSTATFIIAGLSLLSTACSGSSAKEENKNANVAQKSKVVGTRTVKATVREVPKYIEATGAFLADESSDVAAETSGKVSQTLVGEGDFVRTGDVIVRLDERDANLRLQQARAAESQSRAQLVQAEAQLRQSQASLGLDKGGNFSSDNIPAVRQSRAALASRESDRRERHATETGEPGVLTLFCSSSGRDRLRQCHLAHVALNGFAIDVQSLVVEANGQTPRTVKWMSRVEFIHPLLHAGNLVKPDTS